MTWAVHNLHTPPVEVIEQGAARAYKVSQTGAELPMPQPLDGGMHPTRQAALDWQKERRGGQ